MKKSLIYNCTIFILVLLGTIFMFTGYQFMSNTTLFNTGGLEVFKYYTVDSNILVGIASLIMIIYEILFIKKKISKIPDFVYLLKYMGVVGVSLTFIATAFYLSPVLGKNFLFLYMNSNLFFHLVIPALSFVSYVKYEKNKLDYKCVFVTLISVIIYAIFYVTNLLIHLENGQIVKKYDWYRLVMGGIFSMVMIALIVFFIAYLISHTIYKLNKKI